MIIYHEKFEVQSDRRPTFDDVTKIVREILTRSNVKNGTVLVYTGHTTCSLQIQEFSDGKTYWGTELIMQDLVDVLSKIVPTCTHEGMYMHPCAKHIELAAKDRDELAAWSLNTDAHLRSVIMGRSITIPVIDSQLQLGEFGCIYFGDWDQIRARKRTVIVQVMGE
ncbi:MAG: secondary thiamine-phosphate synthase enzyme YjbQ [Clostridia bacterium]